MSKRDDGGPAFPLAVDCSPGTRVEHQMGMSLWDYFAAAALQRVQGEQMDYDPEAAARMAYEHADAMLKERRERSK